MFTANEVEITKQGAKTMASPTTRGWQRATPRAAPGALLVLLLIGAGCTGASKPDADGQRSFASAEEAAAALTEACNADDADALIALFGEEYREVLATSDPSADRQGREAFAAAAKEKLSLEPREGGELEVVVGSQEWPMPIPLMQETGRWRFATEAGIEELLNRRIGRNELKAMELLRGLIDAQYLYQNRDWDGDGRLEFAQRVVATDGASDGLYWAADLENDVPYSPLEGFVADERDYAEGREAGDPWQGYRMKILTAQGPHAPGGARSYLDGDDLLGGFAAVAMPADYGVSGIMTFLVGPDGRILEKDLGEDSLGLAMAMTSHDPDDTWLVVN